MFDSKAMLKMDHFEFSTAFCPMAADVTTFDDSYLVVVYGGTVKHIGSVVLAQPRQSLTGEGLSTTSSVINRLGHMDEHILRPMAEALSRELNAPVCCTGGIHIEHASLEQIQAIQAACQQAISKILHHLKGRA